MKSIVIRYGSYGGLILIGVFLIGQLFFPEQENMKLNEILGYASIILASSLIFFGIRSYRNLQGDDGLSFGKAILVGVLIALIPSFLFGIVDVIYILFINPDFVDQYYTATLMNMEASMTPEEFEIAKIGVEAEREMFASPYVQFVVMFLTVFVIAFIVTLVSALFLQRKPATNTVE
ncbi:DUF4199 domain-containing protein [bacterium SCSIO 12741]|nr:DUF4199 domain-containing protein [bacterium SCSIO 12741]